MHFKFFKCRRIFSFNSFIVFILVINLIILLIDKFITVMYFSARNSVERLQGVYFLINVNERNFYNCGEKPEKFRTSTGLQFNPVEVLNFSGFSPQL